MTKKINIFNEISFAKFPITHTKILAIAIGILFILSISLTYLFSRKKCIYGNCENGFGVQEFKDGTVYSGGFLNGLFSDYGTIGLSNGERYEGGWHRGKKHGKGIYHYTDGSVYEGNFKNNSKYGKGTFQWSDETKLEVVFMSGEPEGLGILTLPYSKVKPMKGIYKNGIIYEGEGIFIYDDGNRYIGNWKNGKENGFGMKLNSEGTIIERGAYKDGNLILADKPK